MGQILLGLGGHHGRAIRLIGVNVTRVSLGLLLMAQEGSPQSVDLTSIDLKQLESVNIKLLVRDGSPKPRTAGILYHCRCRVHVPLAISASGYGENAGPASNCVSSSNRPTVMPLTAVPFLHIGLADVANRSSRRNLPNDPAQQVRLVRSAR